tara:strand:- start:190 stop:492 length:303 start_codon:yes stop_codon:yes gene_type:complete
VINNNNNKKETIKMKLIKINAYKFNELNNEAKSRVTHWLDEMPLYYETQDKNGNIIEKIQYFTDMHNSDICDHCEMNGYWFSENGEYIHHLFDNNSFRRL